MSFFRLFRIVFTSSLLGFLLWRYGMWPNETLVFPKENFQCEVPLNWNLKDSSLFLVNAHRLTGGSFFVAARPVTRALTNVHSLLYRRAFRNKLIADGYTITTEDMDAFQGRDAYAIGFRKEVYGHVIYARAVNFIVGKWRYDLEIVKADGDPVEDAQLENALNSFRLISTP